MCKKLINSLIFRGTEDYQHLWKRPLPEEYFRVKSECMRKRTLQKSLSKNRGAICISHRHTFTIYLVKLRLWRVQNAHSYSIAPETFRQIISIKKCVVLVWLCSKIQDVHWLKNHCEILITLGFLGTEIYLYVQTVKIPFFINVDLSTKIFEFLVQNIPERRKGEFII